MNVDSSRVEMLIPNDDRLTAVIDPVIVHASERAGLSPLEQKELIRDASIACEEAFSRAEKPDAVLHVLVEDSPNRVEVSIEPSSAPGATKGRVTIVKEHSPSASTKR
jgi:hypothetical protein